MNPVKSIRTNQQALLREVRDYVMIALGMLLYSIGWTVFLLPNKIMTGGVPGIASIIYFAIKLPVQYVYFGANVFLLVLAIKILGWKFSIKTIYGVCMLTLSLEVVQAITKGVWMLHDQPFMACVLGASICGTGLGIAFSSNGSAGGTDIVAAIINKYKDITLGRVMMILDTIIITSSYVVLRDWERVVYGFVTLFVCSFMLDQIAINAMHRGVTVIDTVGMYTGQPQKMIFVLAKKRQSTTIFRIINDIDPSAFISQSAVIGVYGHGFDHLKVKQKKHGTAAVEEAHELGV